MTSYRANYVSVDRLQRHILSAVRHRIYAVVIFLVLATDLVIRLERQDLEIVGLYLIVLF